MANGKIIKMLVTGNNDLMWFDSNIKTIKQNYNNKFIAFHNKKIIDSDAKLNNLLKKLEGEGIDTSKVFVRFVSKVNSIL
ncbi:MAG: hypothetical protein ABIB71_05065 [Candidatus Woesearchaeota archaeon]